MPSGNNEGLSLLEEWRRRLQEARPIDDLGSNPVLGADRRYLDEIHAADSDPFATSDSVLEPLDKRLKYLRELSGGELKTISERLERLSQQTGVPVSEGAPALRGLNNQNIGGFFHEVGSHGMPWDAGLAADYRAIRMPGSDHVYQGPFMPANESAAQVFDDLRGRGGRDFKTVAGQFSDGGQYHRFQALLERDAANRAEPLRGDATKQDRGVYADPQDERMQRWRDSPGAQEGRIGSRFIADSRVLDSPAGRSLLGEIQQLARDKVGEPMRRRIDNVSSLQADLLPQSSARGILSKQGSGLEGIAGKVFSISGYGDDFLDEGGLPSGLKERFSRHGGYGELLFATDPVSMGAAALRRNAAGAAGGAAMSLLGDDLRDAVVSGDGRRAAGVVARDAAVGASGEAAIKAIAPQVAPVLSRAATAFPRVAAAAAPAASAITPAMVGAGLFMQGRSDSLLNYAVDKAANVVPGLRPDPRRDLGRMAGERLGAAIQGARAAVNRSVGGRTSGRVIPSCSHGRAVFQLGLPVEWPRSGIFSRK